MRIGRNAIWNVIEIAAATVALFILFKIIVGTLGLGALGIWSLVLATTSLARMADLGVTGGLGKFVAQASARQAGTGAVDAKPLAYVETALFANVILYASVALIAFWPASRALAAVLDGGELAIAIQLLPYAMASFVMASASSVVGAALLGLNRSDLKSQIMIAGLLIQLGVTVALAPRVGLPGVALGQIAQNAFVLSAGWIATCWQAKGRFSFQIPWRLSPSLLRPLVSFGLRLQAVTLASFLYEPIVKFLIAATGGAAALGLFEMAFRLITQSRQFLAAPCQNLLPLYVQATEADLSVEPLYRLAVTLVAVLAAIGLITLTLVAPWIGLLWLGHVEPTLTLFVGVLAVGWFVNMAAIPAFYLGLASGHLRWNIAGSATTTLSALVIGWLLGQVFGPVGIVAGSSLAVAMGAMLIGWGNTRTARVRLVPTGATFQLLAQLALTRFKRPG